ncbi:phosphate acetyltransferase [Leuconostoc gasicomitatum]|nr:phosphate acetyltransferase [Leuconostoc sp.]MBZ5970414.1 phosphate acetyltransferase [Leuconostoc gasicomitatum]MBZ5993155.1 phosphate acetyltransferase [Leuconostoc gasicomitatum]QFS14673.1 phosphate acetyltransferase [Leuconostoc gasicomitatum]SOC22420.1 Phosphate acetyltransferase [Leuconostoc gasicomitatum]
MTKKELFNLMTTYNSRMASLKFYDMADRYILTIGDHHFDLSDHTAENLIADLADHACATITNHNRHKSVKITK